MTDWDDDYESPEEYEAAQRRAEEPPDWYLEEEAGEQLERHRRDEHDGLVCDCPVPEAPRCRLLYRIPRRSLHRGWMCGTPGGCAVFLFSSPGAVWRAHRELHKPPF